MIHTSDGPSLERIALIQWVGRIGAVTAHALAERDDCTLASARGRLLAAERRGLLVRRRPLADGPALFTATRAGLRAAGTPELDAANVTASNARHATVCASVAVALERAYPDHRIAGERELRAEERRAGATLASARMRSRSIGGPLLHRPDLVLWPVPARALPIAVEVELTVKAPRRLLEICRGWARCRSVAGVLYVVAPEVQRPLARAIEKADAAGQIIVVDLDALECHDQPAARPARENHHR